MRVFIAIPLPEPVQKDLGTVQEKVKKIFPKAGKASWVKPENIHLTLKFLGEVDEEKVEQIRKAVKKVTTTSFSAELDTIGVFPNEKYIRVVWVGLEPHNRFIKLQQEIEKVLPEFPKDNKFHPHLTLGRIKLLPKDNTFFDDLQKIEPKPAPFMVDKVILYQSKLSPKGATYINLQEVQMPL